MRIVLIALVALVGCGTVTQDAPAGAGGAGGAGGTAGRGAELAGHAGDHGDGGGGRGGELGAGGATGGSAGAPATGGAGGTDAGAQLPTCPKINALDVQAYTFSAHCWVCSSRTDAGTSGAAITTTCQASPEDTAGFAGVAPAPLYCVPDPTGHGSPPPVPSVCGG